MTIGGRTCCDNTAGTWEASLCPAVITKHLVNTLHPLACSGWVSEQLYYRHFTRFNPHHQHISIECLAINTDNKLASCAAFPEGFALLVFFISFCLSHSIVTSTPFLVVSTSSPTPEVESNATLLTAGAAIGGVGGLIVTVVIVGIIIYCCCIRRKGRASPKWNRQEEMEEGKMIENLSHAPSSSHFGLSQTSDLGISNMFGELSQSDYPHPTSHHQDPKYQHLICGECPIPGYMTLITTLSDCTSEGRKFTDEVNDFSLEIPEGAIPEGERLTIDVGVALFGPFQFPEGLRTVSPVFWVCVRDNPNFQFSKPVTVTIPHFLHLENDGDIQSLGLAFLKAHHNKNNDGLHELQPTDGEIEFEPSQKFGVLKTTHFCSLCIACRDRPDVLTKTSFCITSVLPKCATIGKKQNAFFFITFCNLRTFLAKVDELIKEKKLEHYERTQLEFNFKRFTKNPALEMIVTQPKNGKIGVIGVKKVHMVI